jgi:hypothetical protein
VAGAEDGNGGELMGYSFADRAREKQASRDEDARALASGEKTSDDLCRENGLFAFPEAELDLSGPLW